MVDMLSTLPLSTIAVKWVPLCLVRMLPGGVESVHYEIQNRTPSDSGTDGMRMSAFGAHYKIRIMIIMIKVINKGHQI